MEYEEFIKAYTPQLAIIDTIDLLKHFSPDALETLDQLDADATSDRNDESNDQSDPTL